MERLIFWGTPEWERQAATLLLLSSVHSAQKRKTVDISVNTNVEITNVDDHVDSDEGSVVAWPGSCGSAIDPRPTHATAPKRSLKPMSTTVLPKTPMNFPLPGAPRLQP
jgi:hypothetical protein